MAAFSLHLLHYAHESFEAEQNTAFYWQWLADEEQQGRHHLYE